MATKTRISLVSSGRSNELRDWVPTIGMLPAANRKPLSVTRETALDRARTLMAVHDYSQLPVMNGDRTVHGLVSWKSIGLAAARRRPPEVVGDCLDDKPQSLRQDVPLLDAIDQIAKHELVLVRGHDRTVVGLVTTTDLSEELHRLSAAFLLVGEIEHHLRRLIDGQFTADELRAVVSPQSSRIVEGAKNLSFGEYIRLLQQPANWQRLGLRIDGRELMIQLEAIGRMRNAIMHFRQDDEAPDLRLLRNMVRLLKRL
jgi:CBS domain-containing protein